MDGELRRAAKLQEQRRAENQEQEQPMFKGVPVGTFPADEGELCPECSQHPAGGVLVWPSGRRQLLVCPGCFTDLVVEETALELREAQARTRVPKMDSKRFRRLYENLAGHYGKKVSGMSVQAYYDYLSGKVTTNQVERAMRLHIQSDDSFMPQPPELLRLAKGVMV